MINKIYVELKNIIKEDYLILLLLLVFAAVMLYPLPYYIYTGGGTLSVNDKITVGDTTSKGDFNLCYVSEVRATIPTYLLSKIIPSWSLTKEEDITLDENEDINDVYTRDKIYLEEANQNAVIIAYNKAEIDIDIKDTYLYVIYVDSNSDTDIKVGDDIKEIEGQEINSFEDISNILSNYNEGDKINIKVINNNKEINRYAYVRVEDNKKIIGISLSTLYDYKTNSSISFNFSKSEAGPSGGLMVSLYIYNQLIDTDITNGLKIAGTGTIDQDGNVGSIGGVNYKLKGAVNDNCDIFIVPNGDNYNEAIKEKEKNNYDIEIIGVDTFDDTINKLMSLT